MTTTEQRLADALRAILPFAERDVGELADLACDDDSEDEAMAANADVERAREALAAYDARQVAAPSDGTYTDGPWRMDSDGMTILPPSSDAGGIICRMNVGRDWLRPEAKGNAARIVQCVNAHDVLVAALQACQRVLDDNGGTTPQQWIDAEAAARDALAAAGVRHA